MKVLYVAYDDLQRDGAATVHVASIVNRLAARGHEVWVCAPDGELSPEIQVGHAAMTRATNPFAKIFWRLLGSFGEIVYYILKLKPDVLYVRGVHSTIAPALASLLLFKPCVVEVNGMTELEAPTLARRLILRIAHFLALRQASAVVTISPLLKQAVRGRYGVRDDQVFVVPNGADCERFRPTDRNEARKRLGLSEASTIVLYVGGFYPHHALDLLVECAPEIMGRVPTTQFLLLGDGSERPALEASVREKWLDAALVFAGEVPHANVSDYVAASDACLYFLKSGPSTEHELSPINVYEFMASGRPVFAACDMENVRDFVNANAIGVAEPLSNGGGDAHGEVARLSDTLARLLVDDEMRAYYGTRGRKLAETVYNWDRACDQVERILREVQK